LRNWARYNLIILAFIDMPASFLPLASALFLPFLPVAIVSILLLVYLFKPAVAKVFELGPGPAILPEAEAAAVERVVA